MKEIARRAGVGTAAASVVLNGSRSTSRVSESNRLAILAAAKELNYRPNGLARSLRNRRTGIVGYFSGYDCIDPRNQYIAEVLSGLQYGCVQQGLELLLFTPHAGLTPESIVDNLSNGRLDGIIVTARPEHPVSPLLAESHMPVVAIADPLPGIPSVLADSAAGGRLQAIHLHELGHRRVLYLPADYPFLSVLDRYEGFCTQAAELGMEVVPGRPIHGHHPELNLRSTDRRMWMADEDLAKLKGPGRATAVVAWDDAPAHRIATQLDELGFQIPDEVAIVGYNGCLPATEPRWKLTTVQAPWRDIAVAAIETLCACIAGREFPEVRNLPVCLVRGATT